MFLVKSYKCNQWNLPTILAYISGIFDSFFKAGLVPLRFWPRSRLGHLPYNYLRKLNEHNISSCDLWAVTMSELEAPPRFRVFFFWGGGYQTTCPLFPQTDAAAGQRMPKYPRSVGRVTLYPYDRQYGWRPSLGDQDAIYSRLYSRWDHRLAHTHGWRSSRVHWGWVVLAHCTAAFGLHWNKWLGCQAVDWFGPAGTLLGKTVVLKILFGGMAMGCDLLMRECPFSQCVTCSYIWRLQEIGRSGIQPRVLKWWVSLVLWCVAYRFQYPTWP